MPIHCIADAEKDAGMKTLKSEEAITILEDMKVNISIPKAAVTQIKRNAALNMAIDALLKCSEIPNDSDTISRQAAINAADRADYTGLAVEDVKKVTDEVVKELKQLPSAQPESLTDKEQRIFLAAMGREEKVCKQVDDECRDCREPYEDSLVHICKEIKRKVKGALWN